MSVVRQARLEDAQAIARIEIETWRATYAGMLPDRVLLNNPARFFYERLGGKQVMYRPIPVAGQPVEAIAYGWRDFPSVLGRHAQSRGGLAGEPPVQ